MPTHRRSASGRTLAAAIGCAVVAAVTVVAPSPAAAADTRVPAGQVLRIPVPDAIGGKTVVGQLTVDNASEQGYVTAYGCDDGIPLDANGRVARSDLNYAGSSSSVWSNRLIAQADADGDICLFTKNSVDMIVDINGISFDTGITSLPNRRSDTRVGVNVPRAPVEAEEVLRIRVPEAVGGKTVVGQLTADRVDGVGFVTAFGCDLGLPSRDDASVARSDLNFDRALSPDASNRLIVEADADGEVCFYASRQTELIVDVNGVAEGGLDSFPNRRVDTRIGLGAPRRSVAAGEVLRIDVPEAAGSRTVIGQLTVDRARSAGFVTAFACDDGLPEDDEGVTRSDLNYDGRVAAIWSNRLIVQADGDGEVCLYTSDAVELVIDINATASPIGIFSFPNQRVDTRTGSTVPMTTVPVDASGQPVWPPFTPSPGVAGVSALTGRPIDAATAARPVVAVKIDNFRRARPHFGLDQADVVFEENVEGTTRFVALFHAFQPTRVGPIRSARTSDLDLLSGMNRPVFAYSGANAGVTAWVRSAADSGVLVDFSGLRSPCYARADERPAPHDLVIDVPCAVAAAASGPQPPGPAGELWAIDGTWDPPVSVGPRADGEFGVRMDGVAVGWVWDGEAGVYVRSQDGEVHLAEPEVPITARNVVEIAATHVPSPVDARSPHPITVGGGSAVIHRAGIAIDATWSRATAYDPFEFRDVATGSLIPLDVGTTFVELTRAS
ncbi:MAG: DUF3048 domain-containing protein [Ilumatobacter sp.]